MAAQGKSLFEKRTKDNLKLRALQFHLFGSSAGSVSHFFLKEVHQDQRYQSAPLAGRIVAGDRHGPKGRWPGGSARRARLTAQRMPSSPRSKTPILPHFSLPDSLLSGN
jgi:hypothetical protein